MNEHSVKSVETDVLRIAKFEHGSTDGWPVTLPPSNIVSSTSGMASMPARPSESGVTQSRRPQATQTGIVSAAALARMSASGRAKLSQASAAAAEFREASFAGTDSNRIARRAGFAPQTFYRWFKDKTEIFIAVYRAWEDEELRAVNALLVDGAEDEAVAEAAVAHHRDWLKFRRSLRTLSVENTQVRAARAESRLRQVAWIAQWKGPRAPATDEIAARLLQIERLTDAIAEGEFVDMGLTVDAGRRLLVEILAGLRR
jgi:AcrR family transcriptional regulator